MDISRRTLPALLLALSVPAAVGACAGEPGEEGAETGADTMPAMGAAAGDTAPAAGATGGMAGPGQSTAALRVDTLRGAGAYLTDADGRALYLFTADSAGQSSCYDRCAEAWPPLLAADSLPAAGASAVQAGLLGTVSRPDGESQVTYGSHPLYYFRQDQGAAEATGQDVHGFGGEWYLVTPAGEQLEGGGGGGS